MAASIYPLVVKSFCSDNHACCFVPQQARVSTWMDTGTKKTQATAFLSVSSFVAGKTLAQPRLHRLLHGGRGLSFRVPQRPSRVWTLVASLEQRESGRKLDSATEAVQKLYNAYPFPPDPPTSGAPPGYNWRWHYPTAYAFCAKGRVPATTKVRILDAGCGTGCGTEYLVHLNPQAEVVAFDLSPTALATARERLELSVPDARHRTSLYCKSIFDLEDGEISGRFDMINCVGVIHHTPDPARALQMLAGKLAPGGILHVFVYAEAGRWEIRRMQAAIALIQEATGSKGDYKKGVALGRALFRALPDENRLKKRENERWAHDNRSDATFADMYVHPLEHDFDVPSVLALAEKSGLRFLGWSNARNFDLDHLLGNDPEVRQLVQGLSDAERWRLVELLDPERITHFEFFLARDPFPSTEPTDDEIAASIPEWSECAYGAPSELVLDRDYRPVSLSAAQVAFAKQMVADASSGGALSNRRRTRELMEASGCTLDQVRMLIRAGLVHIRAP